MTAIARERNTWRGTWTLAAGLALWFLAALALGRTGAFQREVAGLPLTLMLGVALPLAAFGVALRVSPSVRAWVGALDIRPLILLHTWRMLGLGFVFLSAYGALSPIFATHAGFGDAAAAVWALWLGVALYQGRATLRSVYLWSAFGLLDFAVAVSLGLLARPGMGVFSEAASTAPMAELPLVLIPGFVVPFFVITHWIVLRNARDQLS